MLKIILCLLFLFSCGAEGPALDRVVHEDVVPYFEQIYAICPKSKKRLKNVHMQIIDLPPDTKMMAYCRTSNLGVPKKIVFNEKDWYKMDHAQRLWLVAHEVGHCAYRLDHTEGGIMNKSMVRKINPNTLPRQINRQICPNG